MLFFSGFNQKNLPGVGIISATLRRKKPAPRKILETDFWCIGFSSINPCKNTCLKGGVENVNGTHTVWHIYSIIYAKRGHMVPFSFSKIVRKKTYAKPNKLIIIF